MTIKTLTILLISLFLGIGCQQSTQKTSRVATLPFYKEATFTPYWLEEDSDSLANFHQIPAFQLTNQNGATISEKTFADKIYITDFFLLLALVFALK